MVEDEKPRIQKVLSFLYDANEPIISNEIADSIKEKTVDVSKDLYNLEKRRLAEHEGSGKVKKWKITDKGVDWLETGAKDENKVKDEKDETVGPIIPTQSELFRSIGERLNIGKGRGGKQEGTPLDTIIYFVQETANLDDLVSVWNALTKMGVANDVKKRWIEIYAKNIPGKEIPEELRDRIASGYDEERVKEEGKPGEIAPKPKRFSLVGNEIVGDPEGDLNFKEALQQRAQNLGARPEEASSAATLIEALKVGPEISTTLLTALLPIITKEPPKQDDTLTKVLLQLLNKEAPKAENTANIIEAMKVGPEMSTALLTVLLPLLTKEPPKQDDTLIKVLQERIEQLADDKHKAEMELLRTEMRTGQKSPESDKQIQALSQQINELREALHNEQLVRIQEQNKSAIEQLLNKIGQLDEQVRAAREVRTVDSKIGLMSSALDRGFGELKGLREDMKPVVEGFVSGGGARTPKRTRDKVGFSEGLDMGIEKEKRLREKEDKLFLGKG